MRITVAFAVCYPGSQAREEASCHIMRMPKQPCGEVYLARA